MSLKDEILDLLERDREFRYAVAGLIGLEEILNRLDRHDEEIAKLREDMVAGFRRHDEEIAKLREDMNKGFTLLERNLSALGARWGLLSEKAFREGLKGLIEEKFGFKVERWIKFDDGGHVFGYPSQVEIDIAIRDGEVILVEVKSHVRESDVSIFWRKAEFYREVERRPSRLIMISPYVEDKALEVSKRLNIEIYTGL